MPDGASVELNGGATVIWGLVVLLLVLWALGFFVASVGSLIHVLLLLAVVAAIYNLMVGRLRYRVILDVRDLERQCQREEGKRLSASWEGVDGSLGEGAGVVRGVEGALARWR